ncbi:NAD(P)-dependent oxidoreductase [Nocardiopsis sp. L17-MgMaSL7]|uniref:NAD(P)-dependent oxidoreductase n=1 Tax=Nocardiopsis sp. L17-MgMaSL7 TaxID=1938893 RepID=UPI000D71B8B6|nr:NAD(P)-dependent oxidoreductase [Nocardiopsis sp. L17-MgMaSL7]PWV52816.1 putative NAD(P)-binding protein [Nocardiopsis sp. L17-MgMaSL7]
MRPKLRPDVYYVPTADGAFIIDSARSVTLRGGAIYQWVELLAPSLDGSVPLEDLTSGLSPAHQKMALDLVGLLERNGFVRDVSDDLPHTLTETELKRYQAEIAYVDFRCDSGPARFQTWRGTRMVVVGNAPLADSAARAAWHLGCSRVEVVDPSDDADARAARAADLAALREEDPALELVETPAADLAASVSAADFVVVLTEDPALIDTVAEACTAPLLPVLVTRDSAWVGPIPGGAAGWADAKARLTDTGTLPAGPSTWLRGPAVGVPANTALFAAFRAVTGAYPAPVSGEVERIDLETLESQTGRVLPVGAAPAPVSEDPRATIDSEAFSHAAAELFDPLTGPLLEIEEHPEQLPLRVAVARLVKGGQTTDVLGVADAFVEARHGATLAALGRLAAAHPASGPARDLVSGETGPVVKPVDITDAHVPGIGAALDRESALSQAVLDYAAERAVPVPERAPLIGRDDLPEPVGEQLRRLELLAQSGVRLFQLDAELPTVLAASDAGALTRASGPDLASAASLAVIRATTAVQCGENPVTTPPRPERVPEPEGSAAPLTGHLLTSEGAVKLLAARGHRLGVVELDGEPALRTATPHLVRVVEL